MIKTKSRLIGGCVTALIALSFSGHCLAKDDQQPGTSEIRSFGYFIGDVVTRRMPLNLSDKQVAQLKLPGAERVNLWFERQTIQISNGPNGQPLLVIRYQVINSPRQTMTVSLPPLTLPGPNGSALRMPAVPITISPLSHMSDSGPDAIKSQIRGDRLPPAGFSQAAEQRRIQWLTALAALLACWLLWFIWRRWHDRTQLPYERAWYDLRKMHNSGTDNAAWHRLHLAINESAGQVTDASNLSEYLSRVGQFSELRGELESFFAASNDRFFSTDKPDSDFDILALAKQLRLVEKQETH